MAQFDASINLGVAVTKALQSIGRVERAIAQVSKTAVVDLKVKGAEKVEQAVKKAVKQSETLASVLNRVENKTLSKLPKQVQVLVAYLKAANPLIKGFAQSAALAAAGVGDVNTELRNFSGYTREIVTAANAMERLAAEGERLGRVRQLASGRSGAGLEKLLQNRIAQRAQISPLGGPQAVKEYERLSRQILQLRSAINKQLKEQQNVENRILDFQIKQRRVIEQNIKASKASREASGFGAFSRGVAEAQAQSAVDKSIARNRAKSNRPFDALQAEELLEKKRLKSYNTRQRREKFLADAWEKRRAARLRGEQQAEDQRKRFHADGLRRVKEFDRAVAQSAKRISQQQAAAFKGFGRNISGAIGGGLTGAGFPAIFGASGGEIAGGGIGGILGGAFGGSGGAFTGSIIGSAIGRLVEAEQVIKDLAKDLGFAEEQTQLLSKAYETLGLKAQENFGKALTALSSTGLEIEDQIDAIRASTALSERYGGDLSRVAGAISKVFNAGKISVADINRLQSEGIPIQQKLAEQLGISRKEVIALARDGELSVKSLADAFTALGREAEAAPKKGKGEFENLAKEIIDLGTEVGNLARVLLRVLGPAIQQIVKEATVGITLIKRLLSVGATADAQRVLTGEAFRSAFTFGTTPEEINELQRALQGLSAGSVQSIADLDELERVVQNFDGRVSGFTGKAGDLSIAQIQPELTRLYTEIEQRRKALGAAGAPLRDPIGDIDPPFEVDPREPKGSAGKERISKVPELERELELQRQLFDIQNKIDTATAAKDSDLVVRLEGQAQLARLAKERADIIANTEIPAEERALQIAINRVQVQDAERATQVELNALQLERTQNIEEAITGFENEVALLQEQTEYAKDLLRIEQEIARLKGQDPNLSDELLQRYRDAAQGAARAREEQRKYNETLQMVQGPVNAFVNGITSGLQSVIDGTMTAEEAFANMLKGMGQALVQTAAQMIAQYIAIGIARAFAGMGGSYGSGAETPLFNNTSTFAGAFSTGGFVGANRVALVGENGPELIRSGPTGTSVTNNEDTKAAMERFSPTNQEAAAGGPMSATINYNGPTLNFNGDDYIPRSEAPQLVAAGAKQGETRAMNRLRQSRSTRSKIGL